MTLEQHLLRDYDDRVLTVCSTRHPAYKLWRVIIAKLKPGCTSVRLTIPWLGKQVGGSTGQRSKRALQRDIAFLEALGVIKTKHKHGRVTTFFPLRPFSASSGSQMEQIVRSTNPNNLPIEAETSEVKDCNGNIVPIIDATDLIQTQEHKVMANAN